MENIEIRCINLKEDIDFLVNCLGATEVYLFGSRGYKTGSTRSDVDVLIKTKRIITMTNFDAYYRDGHSYLDLFVMKGRIVESLITGAVIKKQLILGVCRLNPVLLWSAKRKYCNQSFYQQEIFATQSFFPSAFPHGADFERLKSAINKVKPSNEIQLYFQEAFADYAHESYISTVSMLGCACELIVDELIQACRKRNLHDNPTDMMFDKNITSKQKAKERLAGISDYFAANQKFFKENGFVKIDEHFVMFDLIRNYRNDADHPLGISFSKDSCNLLFGLIGCHVSEIFKIIAFLENNY